MSAIGRKFPKRLLIKASGQVSVSASADGLRRFSMLAYTGGALPLSEYPYPVVVDLEGMLIPSQRRPVFRDHKPWKLVGHTESVTLDKQSWTLTAAGVISGAGPDAREVLAVAGNDFPWMCSIGATGDSSNVEFVPPGATAKANGREFAGPVYVLRKSTLNEISFVPLGADSQATASIAAALGGYAMSFEQWLLGLGYTLEEIGALSEDAKSALQRAYESSGNSASEGETPEMPMAANAPGATPNMPPAVAASVIPSNVVANIPVNVAARLRQEAAAEVRRQESIRRIPGLTPELAGEVEHNGGRQRVNIMAHALEHGWTPERTELEVHRLNSRVQNTFGFVKSSKPSPTPLVIEAAMCRARMLPNMEKQYKPEILEAVDQNFRSGIGLQQVLLMAAAANGYHAGPGERIRNGNLRSVLEAAFPAKHVQVQAGWTPLSVPGILSNVANKEILQGYMEEDMAWKEVAQIKSVPDFKTITSYRLLDSMEYEEVGAGGEIKHGKLDEESYTRQAKTYAKMLAVTRTDIINDDMGAFDDIRNRLGRGAAQKLNNVFWTEWLGNVSTHWTSARTNYISGSTTNLGTDGVGLGLGVKAFRQMRSPSADGSKRVAIRPTILLVPPELETNADNYYNNRNYGAGTTVANANNHAAKYRPVVAAQLSDSNFTGYSTTAWWLLQDPSQGAAIVVSFLDGQQTPTIEDAEADFNVLGIQFRGYHDFGCDMADYLVGVMSKGAA